MQTIAWRAYYNGNVFDSAHSTPEDLPREGLICVLEYLSEQWAPRKHYRRIVSMGDWYWWEGAWHKVRTGAWGTWQPKPRVDAIRSTTRLATEDYDAVMQAVMAARELP